jgi:tRNA-Thr(GGU) m(6)t(6)A37 methyltransferase TsaA
MNDPHYEVTAIGTVRSPLTDPASAPKQGYEGSPDPVVIEFHPEVLEALRDIRPGDQVIVLTWLDRARRDVVRTHPRDDLANPEVGVFSTRSPDRPNPIGLHLVEVVSRDDRRLEVRNLEALDGTPVIDLKPTLPGVADA